MFSRNCLTVVIINLIIFGIIELMSLSSMDVLTPARVLVLLGLILNVVLLVVCLSGRPKLS